MTFLLLSVNGGHGRVHAEIEGKRTRGRRRERRTSRDNEPPKTLDVENKINTNVVRKIDIDYFGIYIENDGRDISR